jgi:hypothetical protein
MSRLRSKTRYKISPLADQALFIKWCRETNARLRGDEEYELKRRQRNLRSRHRERLSELQQQLEDSIATWKSHSSYPRSCSLSREIEGKEKAVRNMERFLEIDPATVEKESEREKISRTQIAFEKNQSELAAMKTELGLLHAIAEHQEMAACAEALHNFSDSIGLTEIKAILSTAQRERGGKRGERGKSFEDLATEAVLVCPLSFPPSPSPIASFLFAHRLTSSLTSRASSASGWTKTVTWLLSGTSPSAWRAAQVAPGSSTPWSVCGHLPGEKGAREEALSPKLRSPAQDPNSTAPSSGAAPSWRWSRRRGTLTTWALPSAAFRPPWPGSAGIE